MILTPEERKHRRMMKVAWSAIVRMINYRRIVSIDITHQGPPVDYPPALPWPGPNVVIKTLTIKYF